MILVVPGVSSGNFACCRVRVTSWGVLAVILDGFFLPKVSTGNPSGNSWRSSLQGRTDGTGDARTGAMTDVMHDAQTMNRRVMWLTHGRTVRVHDMMDRRVMWLTHGWTSWFNCTSTDDWHDWQTDGLVVVLGWWSDVVYDWRTDGLVIMTGWGTGGIYAWHTDGHVVVVVWRTGDSWGWHTDGPLVSTVRWSDGWRDWHTYGCVMLVVWQTDGSYISIESRMWCDTSPDDRIPSTTPGAEPPRGAKDSGSARSHSTHLETSSQKRP